MPFKLVPDTRKAAALLIVLAAKHGGVEETELHQNPLISLIKPSERFSELQGVGAAI
ncbi:hypothetical protein [Devosia yakushimensis]|uniref:hypothetical protein n=1 Tax=Devosia yakushimensis TaxID=470028 RepID=UPI0024E0E12E|nr:hypothetical protein [Devosia yakushimensis]